MLRIRPTATTPFAVRTINNIGNLLVSRLMRKPTIGICENKGADQLRGNSEADQRLCFRYTDSTIPLLPKIRNFVLLLCSPLCVGPCRKQQCWFSHEAAQLLDVCPSHLNQKTNGLVNSHLISGIYTNKLGIQPLPPTPPPPGLFVI